MNEKENTKIVQDMYAAYTRGDVPGILSHMDNSITFTVPGTQANPLAGTRRGLAAMKQFYADLASIVDLNVFEPREYIAQGNKVVVLVHYAGTFRSTGRRMEADSAMVWTLENGKVVRFQEYTDTEAAANAARPSGQASGASR